MHRRKRAQRAGPVRSLDRAAEDGEEAAQQRWPVAVGENGGERGGEGACGTAPMDTGEYALALEVVRLRAAESLARAVGGQKARRGPMRKSGRQELMRVHVIAGRNRMAGS